MQTKLHSTRAGFTLVEIMIVVAIIALLASIAVPGFIRARQRSQATAILETCRQIDAAKDQYAIESGKGNVQPAGTDLQPYVKLNSKLWTDLGAGVVNDALGNPITIGKIDENVKVSAVSLAQFNPTVINIAEFFGPYQ